LKINCKDKKRITNQTTLDSVPEHHKVVETK